MPPPTVFRAGNTALITGAASGIGLAVAKRCRQHGMKLILIDKDTSALSSAKAALSSSSSSSTSTEAAPSTAAATTTTNDEIQTECISADISDPNEWKNLRTKVEQGFTTGVDFLMLNAGVQVQGGWEDMGYFQKTFSTNLGGVTMGLATFLPLLRSSSPSNPKAIVITGSKQGITNPPGNPAYNASKAAIKSLAESLSYELRDTDTAVHLLVPGWTFTGLTGGGGLKEKPQGAWWPEQVAEFLEGRMEEGRFYVVCPDDDVSEEMDRRRMLWAVGDVVNGRRPLSRWREEYKGEAEEWMARQEV